METGSGTTETHSGLSAPTTVPSVAIQSEQFVPLMAPECQPYKSKSDAAIIVSPVLNVSVRYFPGLTAAFPPPAV